MLIGYTKEVLTTGEVAKICHVAPRTVSKWFDTGKLRGYRIPGSRDRRIPLSQLLAFMRAHGIPLEALDGGVCRALLVGSILPEIVEMLNASSRYRVRTAANGFEAGVIAQRFHPHVIVLDVTDAEQAEAIATCRNIKTSAELATVKVLAAIDESAPGMRQELVSYGFDGCLSKPYTASQLAEAIEEATDLIT